MSQNRVLGRENDIQRKQETNAERWTDGGKKKKLKYCEPE